MSIFRQSFSRSVRPRSLSIDNLRKSYRSSKWDFSSIRIDQTSSSNDISQHMSWSSMMFECRRIAGWLNTIISLIIFWKTNSSLTLFVSLTRLKARLVCEFINVWSILAVSSISITSRVDCHVTGKKSISNFWAIARTEIKSYWAFIVWLSATALVAIWRLLVWLQPGRGKSSSLDILDHQVWNTEIV